MRAPKSRFLRYCVAKDSLTTTTGFVLSVSASANARPRNNGIPRTWKYSGLTRAVSVVRCFLHAWKLPCETQHFMTHRGDRRNGSIMIRLRVIRKRNPDTRHHQLVRIETGIGLHGVPEAVQE